MKIWNSPAGTIKLKRFPFEGQRSHQAWDSADEWITGRFPKQEGRILVIGEAFGVLGTAWGERPLSAAGDSSLSLSALERNRMQNPQKNTGALSIIRSTELDDAEGGFDRIFIRIPKSLSLLDFYLSKAVNLAGADTEIWLGAMDKRWSSGVRKITDRYLQTVEVFPFERHSRWIKFRMSNTAIPSQAGGQEWKLEKYPLKFKAAPDVFGSAGLDEGTAAFLQAFPEEEIMEGGLIADMGCGSGTLGLCAAYINPEASILFTDESYLAVKNTEENYRLNNLTAGAEFQTANGLGEIKTESADIILCNPPFHFQNIQSREPAEFLFSEAARALRSGGLIQIVGNSHLGYHKLLGNYFKDVREVYRDRKFTVLTARA